MNIFNKLVISAGLLACAGSAQAIMLDFKADANLLEKGYSTLTYGQLNITASGPDDDGQQFAYMDKGNAGLGACRDITDTDAQCTPSWDDNVGSAEANESVLFNWVGIDVTVTGIWFNNNHDENYSLVGDRISINGTEQLFAASNFDGNRSFNDNLANSVDEKNADFLFSDSFVVLDGDTLEIAFVDEQFYISAIRYEVGTPPGSVPVPGTLALLGLGLAGIGGQRRRKLMG